MISYDKAIQIAKTFADEIARLFTRKVKAVFAIGSLGSDYYRVGQSDIDTAVVLNCNREERNQIKNELDIITDRYWHE